MHPPAPTVAPTATLTSISYPSIAGSYRGSFTWYGQPGINPMQIQISQSGQNLTGTTTEGPIVYNDTGTIDTDGNFTITEKLSGSTVACLYSSSTGSNFLSGTWRNTAGRGGTWDVFK